MSGPLTIGGVVGTDNVSPLYNPEEHWRIWNMSEIYLGLEATRKNVPKINDLVFEIIGTNINKYVVIDINPVTMVPVLREVRDMDDGMFTEDDILLGVGPGTQSDTYRIYVDKSVTPHRLCVDARLKVGGTMCRWCKIFRGSNISSEGNVISRMYDTNGNLISENIPLELAATELLDNRAIKVVSSAFTNADLADGEVVTAVLYDDNGYVVSKRQLLVENTAFIRSTDADKKYIVAISLKSPFISSSNARLIQYPLNVPLNGLNLTGVVTYSNGETAEYPVDGTKFSIFGFEQFVATQVGQRINLVLKYSLANNEVAYNAVMGGDQHIAEHYEAMTMAQDGTYNLKLYAYPVWINALSGYRLEWFLYNLDRNINYKVTNQVYLNANTAPFDPFLYGQLQRISASINIKNVNVAWKNYVHTQTLDIAILRPGSDRDTNWTVAFTTDQVTRYGINTHIKAKFVSTNMWQFDLRCGMTTLSQWLDKMYVTTQPLYNNAVASVPPVPTHFALTVNNVRTEYPIAQWNSLITINQNVPNSSTVFIEFIRKTGTTDLFLSIAAMIVWHVDSAGNVIA
jgi:hypothetical protein